MALILLSRFLSSDSLRNEGFFVPSYAMSGLFRHPLRGVIRISWEGCGELTTTAGLTLEFDRSEKG
jgi:hypothetical protein